MSNIFSRLQRESEAQKQQAHAEQSPASIPEKITPNPTQNVTRNSTPASMKSRGRSRKMQRTHPRDRLRELSREVQSELPTRDEIQEFSFRLRDELKVKVQAEVPHGWQRELEDLSHRLKVKKLELYRYIIGSFLGKVKRSREADQ